jgi:hypothetical protein
VLGALEGGGAAGTRYAGRVVATGVVARRGTIAAERERVTDPWRGIAAQPHSKDGNGLAATCLSELKAALAAAQHDLFAPAGWRHRRCR